MNFTDKLRRRSLAALQLVLLLALGGPAPAQPPAAVPDAVPGVSPLRPPAWLADGGAQARVALRLLDEASLHGLDPASYAAPALARRLDALSPESATQSTAEVRALEHDLTAAMLRYLADLHRGRTPSGYRPAAPASAPVFDARPLLAKALDERRLEAAVEAAAPAFPLYRRVQASLAEYRALARDHPHWPPLPPVPPDGLAAETTYAGAGLLRERLRLLGDLDGDAPAGDGDAYAGELAAALRRFQARHGLAEDGVLGANTLAALSVPPSRRALQLALTLERLRWLPPPAPGRTILVNLPAYRLWAFDTRDAVPGPILEMRVIVGSAVKTPTPLFIGAMRSVEFNPYWNVPRSIAVNEIIPKLARNPGYLRQNDMELVSRSGQVLASPAAGTPALLRAGSARVRQRPGPKNALGGVKFGMPNPMDIYLHSTGSPELFARTRRDLSHGCIRVEHPAALAAFVLADPREWSVDAVTAAIGSGLTRSVRLPEVVPVVLFYATAVTDRQGRALFAEDIYGRDAGLAEALAR